MSTLKEQLRALHSSVDAAVVRTETALDSLLFLQRRVVELERQANQEEKATPREPAAG